jgi:hypothetical protein
MPPRRRLSAAAQGRGAKRGRNSLADQVVGDSSDSDVEEYEPAAVLVEDLEVRGRKNKFVPVVHPPVRAQPATPKASDEINEFLHRRNVSKAGTIRVVLLIDQFKELRRRLLNVSKLIVRNLYGDLNQDQIEEEASELFENAGETRMGELRNNAMQTFPESHTQEQTANMEVVPILEECVDIAKLTDALQTLETIAQEDVDTDDVPILEASHLLTVIWKFEKNKPEASELLSEAMLTVLRGHERDEDGH